MPAARRVLVTILVVAALASSCSTGSHHPAPRAVVPATTVPPATTSTSTTGPGLVPWTGPVEHLFFHTLVIRPELAFGRDAEGQGFRDYFVTVGEFRAILSQLDAHGWTLVDIHRAVAGTVKVPAGRKPLVLSEDDVNYYNYSRSRGLGWRLVLDAAGDVKVEVRDNRGVRVTDEDLVPIVDQFVAQHPEFSAEGAKGVLGLTGYQGLLGERSVGPASPDGAARAAAVAARLKSSGWVFANHSYGHIDFSRDSTAVAQRDTERWKAEAEPIIGPTDVFIYPFGAEPRVSSPTVAMLADHGFTILCDIDVAPRMVRANGVVVMARRHIDGLALEGQARHLAPFFDAALVEDRAARYANGPARSSPAVPALRP